MERSERQNDSYTQCLNLVLIMYKASDVGPENLYCGFGYDLKTWYTVVSISIALWYGLQTNIQLFHDKVCGVESIHTYYDICSTISLGTLRKFVKVSY